MLRIALAALHLLALGIGLGGVLTRAAALCETPLSRASARRAFAADTQWGAAALFWIGTGLWRLVAQLEKPVAYYRQNELFIVKMGLLLLILALEAWPMATLIRWRIRSRRTGDTWQPDERVARRRIAAISYGQAAIVVAMVALATALARGLG